MPIRVSSSFWAWLHDLPLLTLQPRDRERIRTPGFCSPPGIDRTLRSRPLSGKGKDLVMKEGPAALSPFCPSLRRSVASLRRCLLPVTHPVSPFRTAATAAARIHLGDSPQTFQSKLHLADRGLTPRERERERERGEGERILAYCISELAPVFAKYC